MKQVININFQGRVVPIEVSAFEILKNYTESLNRYFAMEEGRDEIINDIESRIGELFQERIKAGSTCITDDDINAIIKSMGRPEDFEADQVTAETVNERRDKTNEGKSNSFQTGTPKRLFRDENDKILGGVCSGVANYLGIDVVVVRILFVVLFGVLLLPYFILWIAVPSTATTEIGSVRKKLYRDSDNKIIGGVCSGIANYFGINVWIPRLFFLIPFLSFVSRWEGFDFVRIGFSPGSLIVYIILWLVLPEAFTTAEKLVMKGEKVDMNSIKNSVMEEMKGVHQRAEKFGREARSIAQDRGKSFGADIGSIARRGGRSLGDIIILLFKIFAYFILGCIAMALVVGLFALGIFAIGIFPMKDFVLTDGWQNIMAWGTLIFFIAIPIIGIITWLIRRLAKIKSNRKTMRWAFAGLWLVGILCFISLIVSVGRDFRANNNFVQQNINLSNPFVSKLEITSVLPDQKFHSNRWFRLEPFTGYDEDTAILKNVTIHIVKSTSDSFRVSLSKRASGRNRHSADTLASLINFNVIQKDSLLLIDKGISITRKDKFRNQGVVITIFVPVGKQVRVNKSVGWSNNIHLDGPWNNNDWDVDFDDVEEGWDMNTDYIMKEDGLYKLNGTPADTWKHKIDVEENGVHVQGGNTDINIDKNGIRITDGSGNYRYESKDSLSRIDSMKIKLNKMQETIKDSLQKAKERIEKQLEKLNDKAGEPSASVSYTFPGYNPWL